MTTMRAASAVRPPRRREGVSLERFDRLHWSMPQNNPGGLAQQQYVEILAYILDIQGAPAGTSELPTKSEVLNTIKYIANTP